LAEDHAIGLSTFTIMAGFGGSVGYLIGAINWENVYFLQSILGTNHERIVFLLCTFAFVICAILTITSFREIPLDLLIAQEYKNNNNSDYKRFENDEYEMNLCSTSNDEKSNQNEVKISIAVSSPTATFSDYIHSIIKMPASLRILCVTNLFSWMSLVCYSLYFTDFVGESVFRGDPTSANPEKFQLYQNGIRFGCLCMTFYSLSCSFYSYYFETLIKFFGKNFLSVKINI
jgi:solute carrier family 45 protein 1/2/4